MAKTAPDTFKSIPDGKILPKEPIIEGNAAGAYGPADVVRNVNHVTRSLAPTVVMQYANDTAQAWLSETSVGAVPGNLRYVWRVPVFNDSDLDTLQIRVASYTLPSGQTGNIRFSSSIANTDITVPYVAAPYPILSDSVRMDVSSNPYETVSMYTTLSGTATQMRVKGITLWQARGGNPLTANGLDVEPYEDDEPLATYMYSQLKARTEQSNKERRGVATAWSTDIDDVTRSYYTIENDRASPLVYLPVRYGPLTSKLRVHVNGYCDVGTNEVNFKFTRGKDAPQIFDELSLTLPASGAFDAQTSWVSGTVDVPQRNSIGTGFIEMEIYSPSAGNPLHLSGISIWEEPIA